MGAFFPRIYNNYENTTRLLLVTQEARDNPQMQREERLI